MERLGLAIQKSENTSIKDHHLGAGKLVQFVQEKEQKIDHLNEHISELQEQLENTTDNKVRSLEIFCSVSLFLAVTKKRSDEGIHRYLV